MESELKIVHVVEVTPDSGKKTRLQRYKKLDKGVPDVKPAEPKVTKEAGTKLRVSGTHKVGNKDTGDGLIHGKDGRSFYFVTDDPFNGEAAKLLVKESDVQIFRTGEVYTVKAGDSLSKIAKEVYPNNAYGLQMILENNKEVIGENPDMIHPGQKLFVPFNTH